MKIVIAGLWASVVIVSAGFVKEKLNLGAPKTSEAASESQLTVLKTKELNVPRIKDGVIKGYIIAQVSYTLDAKLLKNERLADSVVCDELFKYLYQDAGADLDRLDKFDLNKMTSAVKAETNEHLKVPAVSDVGILEFQFFPTSEPKAKSPPSPD